jgi:hypothetical protein
MKAVGGGKEEGAKMRGGRNDLLKDTADCPTVRPCGSHVSAVRLGDGPASSGHPDAGRKDGTGTGEVGACAEVDLKGQNISGLCLGKQERAELAGTRVEILKSLGRMKRGCTLPGSGPVVARGTSGFAASLMDVDWGAGAARTGVRRDMEKGRVVRRGRSMVMVLGAGVGG